MLSYDEVKNFGKKAGKKQSDREKLLKGSEPAKEAMYKKWQETKVAGGTVNSRIAAIPYGIIIQRIHARDLPYLECVRSTR